MKKLISSIIKSKTVYVLVIALGLLIGLLQSMQPTFSNFTLMTPSGTSQAINFPGFMQSPEGGVYRLSGTLTMGKYSSSLLRIIPDDEILTLTINQQPVDPSINKALRFFQLS